MKLKDFAFYAPCVWGTTYFVTTQFLPADKPLLAALIRALPAGLILIFGKKLPPVSWLWRLFVLGALNIGVFFVMLFFAAYRLPGGVVALVGSLQPLIVILLSFLLLMQPVLKKQMVAAIIGGIGIVLLISLPQDPLDPAGLVASVVATISMASGLVLTKKWGRPAGMAMLTFTGWQLFCGGLVILPVQMFLEPLPHAFTLTNLVGYFYLAIPGSLLAYFMWFSGLEANSPVIMSMLGFLSPMVALLLGFLFLHQGLSSPQLIGVILIFSAIIIVQDISFFGRRKKSTQLKQSKLISK
ncbi:MULTISPECIES: carboxylate/amino acid/amine transporter [Dickeya]|uniref:Carboxylate/amino acid/amine transporter n=1 Tax=Dickeya zeae (strain Ech586) TaxID=590409 RepID=D2C0N6_DICZ5|nr:MULTISPECIES: carboxylate/amino acid/amine transporter [Dickeya]ACZ74979.1 carboxylate/amino acid/amine transporter [Dickeya parazeae Ech586]MBP2836417.1 DMT family transporter [Dickeya parazeae]UCZ77083.1 carboxylate/amino acid/amine transporter [Dickeya zeae]